MVRQLAATKRLLNCLRARTGYNLYVTDCQLTLLTYKSVLSWHATDFFSRCWFWLLVCGFPFSSMPSNLAELPRNWCSYAPSMLLSNFHTIAVMGIFSFIILSNIKEIFDSVDRRTTKLWEGRATRRVDALLSRAAYRNKQGGYDSTVTSSSVNSY